MSRLQTKEQQIEVVKEYFRRLDAGRPDVLDLFTDDVEIYFPKFGVANGKKEFGTLGGGMQKALAGVAHDIEGLRFVSEDAMLVAEGTTQGVTQSGISWKGAETAGGRFCSVYQFRGSRIERMYIYLDPDYGSEDLARFLWPNDGSRRW